MYISFSLKFRCIEGDFRLPCVSVSTSTCKEAGDLDGKSNATDGKHSEQQSY